MIIAIRLGSYLLGIWGVFLLLRRYLQLINLGIPDSSTILLVHNKDNTELKMKIESNAIIIIGLLSFLILLSGIFNYIIGIEYISKYNLKSEYILLCFIAIFTLYDDLFCKIYRVEGRIGEITFYQSIIQLLSFAIVLFFSGLTLIHALIIVYLLGTLSALIVFLARRRKWIKPKIDVQIIKSLINKGFFLFAYNFVFYLIFISTRTLVSVYYSVRDFGYFTFAYTLSNAIILLIDAVAALLIPKLIDRYHSNVIAVIEDTIEKLKTNYTYASYSLMFILLIGVLGLLYLLPEFYNTVSIVILMSATVVLQAHSFPYTVYMMAHNKEKLIAMCSLLALIINLLLTLIAIIVLHVEYQFVIIGTWISYFCFTVLCIYFSKKNMGENCSLLTILYETMPCNLAIPIAILLVSGIVGNRLLLIISSILFFILNYKKVIANFKTLLLIINNPQIVNIKEK